MLNLFLVYLSSLPIDRLFLLVHLINDYKLIGANDEWLETWQNIHFMLQLQVQIHYPKLIEPFNIYCSRMQTFSNAPTLSYSEYYNGSNIQSSNAIKIN